MKVMLLRNDVCLRQVMYLLRKSCGNFSHGVRKVFFGNGCGCVKVKAAREARRGFLRGRIREVAVNLSNAVIMGGIRADGSIDNIIYPVLLPRRTFTAEAVETKSRGWNRLN